MKMLNLTALLLRELIDYIDVYETESIGKNRTQRAVFYYQFVGYLNIFGYPWSFTEDTRQDVAVEYVSCELQGDILDKGA